MPIRIRTTSVTISQTGIDEPLIISGVPEASPPPPFCKKKIISMAIFLVVKINVPGCQHATRLKDRFDLNRLIESLPSQYNHYWLCTWADGSPVGLCLVRSNLLRTVWDTVRPNRSFACKGHSICTGWTRMAHPASCTGWDHRRAHHHQEAAKSQLDTLLHYWFGSTTAPVPLLITVHFSNVELSKAQFERTI